MKVLVAQSRLTLGNPMNCSLPGSFVHGIFQARILPMDRGSWWPTVHRITKSQTWLKRLSTAIPFSRGSSSLRDQMGLLHFRQILCLPSHQGSTVGRLFKTQDPQKQESGSTKVKDGIPNQQSILSWQKHEMGEDLGWQSWKGRAYLKKLQIWLKIVKIVEARKPFSLEITSHFNLWNLPLGPNC